MDTLKSLIGKEVSMLRKNRRISKLILLTLLCCAPSAYAGVYPKKPLKGVRIVPQARRILNAGKWKQTGRAPISTGRQSAQAAVNTGKAVATRPPLTRATLVTEPISSFPVNSLSRRMQQNLAREMRPYLYSFDTYIAPERPPAFDDVYGGVQSAGNLTEMSKQQMAVAQKAHQTAMQQVREVAKTVNTNIYYLGTSETEHLSPEYIRQMVGDIEVAQDAVAGAQVIWGQEPSLEKASLYLQQVRQFYSMLGTGIYEHINPIANPVIKRADGHVYNAEEFGLRSRQDTHEIPRVTTAEQAAWVNSTYGELPQRMRVAVLQDDKAIINGLHVMRQRVGLKDWTMDFYEDPEAFLGSPKALQYDMVLTDVLIKNGGGRYLARQLRSRGYEGSIITISGFEASAHSGKSFFADGIDGMIALGWVTDYADKIWYSLTKYFKLKAEHGWLH